MELLDDEREIREIRLIEMWIEKKGRDDDEGLKIVANGLRENSIVTPPRKQRIHHQSLAPLCTHQQPSFEPVKESF